MDHQVALSSQAVERYTLGELTSPEREEFEEHFFSCPDCAEALRECEVFVANTRAVLREDRAAAQTKPLVAVPPAKADWWKEFRKWFAVPAVAFAGLALAFLLLRAPGGVMPDPNGPRVEWALLAESRDAILPRFTLPGNAVWAELSIKLQALEPDRWASYHWEVHRLDDGSLVDQGNGHGAGLMKAKIAASRFQSNKAYKLTVQGDPATDPLGSSFVVERN